MDDLSPRIQEIRGRQKQLNATKWELEALLADCHVQLADEVAVRRYVEELRELLGDSPLAERRSFIRIFVKEVKVGDDQAILTCTIPVSPDKSTEEGILVPLAVQHGGR